MKGITNGWKGIFELSVVFEMILIKIMISGLILPNISFLTFFNPIPHSSIFD